MRWIDADELRALVSMSEAIDAIEGALRGGLDPAADVARSRVDVQAGQLLLMPSAHDLGVGVKVATIAPGNAARDLPTIHATYVLFDAATLEPTAGIDGTALTSLRTPAVSAVAVRHLAARDATRLVVFGTGPQARGHVEAVRAVRPIERVTVVGRDAGRTAAFVEAVSRDVGDVATVRAGQPEPPRPERPPERRDQRSGWHHRRETRSASRSMARAVADADVVVCATSAAEPLFEGDLVAPHACVVAIGAHEPDRRELPSALLARAMVVVEDRATALREAGDVVLAIAEGAVTEDDLTELATLVRSPTRVPPSGPTVFKGTGMAWQDLVVAAEASIIARGG